MSKNYKNTMAIKRFKNFRVNEMMAEQTVLRNSFVRALIEDAGLEYEMKEDPDGLAFDVMDAITVFRHDYNEDHPFIHYLNELANRFDYTPSMGLSHDSLESNAVMLYDELVNGQDFYMDKFLDGVYESVNEGIDSEGLNPQQQAALDELKSSDVSLFDDNDFQHFADKIGVSIEQVMELVADGGTSTHDEIDEMPEELDSELKELVRKELVDNEEVDAGNLMYKIQELVDKLESDDYYEWGNEEWDEYYGKYETLTDTIRKIYNELTGVNNPNQTKMEFESIKRFKDFNK